MYWELGIVADDITMDTACIDICAIAPTYKEKEERRRGKKEEGEERGREGGLASLNTGAYTVHLCTKGWGENFLAWPNY